MNLLTARVSGAVAPKLLCLPKSARAVELPVAAAIPQAVGYADTSGYRPLVSAPRAIHHGSGDFYWAVSQFNFIERDPKSAIPPKN